MYCPNCSKELPDGSKFCGGCGAPIAASQTPMAPVETETFAQPEAPVYETPVYEAPEAPAYEAETYEAPAYETETYEAPVAAPIKPAEKKSVDVMGILNNVKNTVVDIAKKIPAKYLKIGAAALAVVLVILLVSSLFGGEKAPNYGMYMKEDKAFFTSLNGKAGTQLTKKDLSGFRMTEDGKMLFFKDGKGDLYYFKTSSKKEPVKLDSNVSSYWFSENGKLVTYTKNGDLYQHNLKEEEKIAKDVSSVAVSDDGKIIYYHNDDDAICWKNGKEEEIDSDVYIIHYSEDFKTILYTDGEDIYSKKVGKKAKVVAAEIGGISAFPNKDGAFYYWTFPEGDMEDYFDDDDLSGDMNFLSTLYYFNGSKSKKIATNVYVDTDLTTANASGQNVAIYYYQFGKVAEGDLDYDDLQDLMEDDMGYEEAMIELLTEVSGKCNRYIGINGKAGKVKIEEEISQFYLSGNGKTMYALVDVDDGEGTLMKASVSGNKVKSFKEVDTDVPTGSILGFLYAETNFGLTEYPEENAGNLFVYFKDVKDGEGELFINGKSAAEDVYTRGLLYNPGKKTVMFYVDYKDGEGTLCMHNGKKLTEIAEDVCGYSIHRDGDVAFKSDYKNGEYTLNLYTGKVKLVAEDVSRFSFTADGDILYLTEVKNGEGDLYLYTGKAKLIDEDVTGILSTYSCPNA